MNREQIKAGLIEILSSPEWASLQVDVTQVTEETSLLNDLALDSLQLLEFIVAIEKAFRFKANMKRLNIDTFDRFTRLIDFVEASVVESSKRNGDVYAVRST